MREIDKMIEIRDNLNDVEKRSFDEALNNIGDTFKAMVYSVKDYILNAEEKKIQLETAKTALNTVKQLADKAGIEMPDFDTDEKVKAYSLKYGMEIVNN